MSQGIKRSLRPEPGLESRNLAKGQVEDAHIRTGFVCLTDYTAPSAAHHSFPPVPRLTAADLAGIYLHPSRGIQSRADGERVTVQECSKSLS